MLRQQHQCSIVFVCISIITCSVCIISLLAVVSHATSYRRIRLQDVSTLTFVKGQRSTARRSSPVKKLLCIGGAARYEFEPDSIQCTNAGWDGHDVQWKCVADVPNEFRLGKTIVSCEGFEFPEDEYILAGSCGLEYTMEYAYGHQKKSRWSNSYSDQQNDESFFSSTLSWMLFLLIGYFLYTSCCSGGSHPGSRGGGGDDYHSPGDPPPYSSWSSSSNTPNWSSAYPSCAQPSFSSSSASSGPGFFSGLGLGSAMGYLFGGRNRARNNRTTWNSDRSNTGSWFGGNSYSSSAWDNDGGSSTRRTSVPTSPTHTSTSYATTRRR